MTTLADLISSIRRQAHRRPRRLLHRNRRGRRNHSHSNTNSSSDGRQHRLGHLDTHHDLDEASRRDASATLLQARSSDKSEHDHSTSSSVAALEASCSSKSAEGLLDQDCSCSSNNDDFEDVAAIEEDRHPWTVHSNLPYSQDTKPDNRDIVSKTASQATTSKMPSNCFDALPIDVTSLIVSFVYNDLQAVQGIFGYLDTQPEASWRDIKHDVAQCIRAHDGGDQDELNARQFLQTTVMCASCSFPVMYPTQLQDCGHIACGRCVYETHLSTCKSCAECGVKVRSRPKLLNSDFEMNLALSRLYWLTETYDHFRFILDFAESPVHGGEGQNILGKNGIATTKMDDPFFGLGFISDYDDLPVWNVEDENWLEHLDEVDERLPRSFNNGNEVVHAGIDADVKTQQATTACTTTGNLQLQQPSDPNSPISIFICPASRNFSPYLGIELDSYHVLKKIWPEITTRWMSLFELMHPDDLILIEESPLTTSTDDSVIMSSSTHLEIRLVGWEHLASSTLLH